MTVRTLTARSKLTISSRVAVGLVTAAALVVGVNAQARPVQNTDAGHYNMPEYHDAGAQDWSSRHGGSRSGGQSSGEFALVRGMSVSSPQLARSVPVAHSFAARGTLAAPLVKKPSPRSNRAPVVAPTPAAVVAPAPAQVAPPAVTIDKSVVETVIAETAVVLAAVLPTPQLLGPGLTTPGSTSQGTPTLFSPLVAVPEPGTGLLALLGLASLFGLRRRVR